MSLGSQGGEVLLSLVQRFPAPSGRKRGAQGHSGRVAASAGGGRSSSGGGGAGTEDDASTSDATSGDGEQEPQPQPLKKPRKPSHVAVRVRLLAI